MLDEGYSAWSIEKFCRLIERYREGEHMAGTQEVYLLYHRELVKMEEAFRRLHPRAYQNFERRFHAQFE